MTRSRRGRIPRLPALLALAAAACTVDATGLHVTLFTTDRVDSIQVVVQRHSDHMPIVHGGYQPTGGISNNATFGVRLADDLDGTMVDVVVDAYVNMITDPIACGTAPATVVKNQAVEVTVTLSHCGGGGVDMMVGDMAGPDLSMHDMAIDMAIPEDLAVPDLADGAMPDVAMPDLTMPDVAMPDLATPDLMSTDLACGMPKCSNSVASGCCGGPVNCYFKACAGNGMFCYAPACAAPGMLTDSVASHFDPAGAADNSNGTCNVGSGSPEAAYSFTLNSYSTVRMAASAPGPIVLYSRWACMVPDELPVGGPCTGMLPGPIGAG
jgi:hypothetical protein